MNAICATSDPTSHFCTEEEFTFASRDEELHLVVDSQKPGWIILIV